MKLEFTTTACVRPELLDQTYSSLNDVLVDVDLKTEGVLYINIDPVPDSSEQAINEELEVARSHFSEVHHRVGEPGGNFSRAASWTLSQPTGEYFFNVEDDWLFGGENNSLKDVEFYIQDYIHKIESDPRDNILQCMVVRGKRNRISFMPSLFKTTTIQNILKQYPIPENENPEGWLWELKTPKQLVDYNVTFLSGVPPIDIGTEWMKAKGYSKNQDNFIFNPKSSRRGNFVRWNLK